MTMNTTNNLPIREQLVNGAFFQVKNQYLELLLKLERKTVGVTDNIYDVIRPLTKDKVTTCTLLENNIIIDLWWTGITVTIPLDEVKITDNPYGYHCI